MIARFVAVAVGIWLMAAPAVLDHGETAADNDRAVGPVIACLAFVAVWAVARPLRWATLPLGAWLVVAPLVLGYDHASVALNSVACGLVVVAVAPLGGTVSVAYGGGWRSLVSPSGSSGDRRSGRPGDARRPDLAS